MKNLFLSSCVVLGMVLPVVAFCAETSEPSRKVDFSKPLLDVKNEPFHPCSEDKPECKRIITLGEVVALGLSNPTPESQKDDGLTKLRKSMLATKVYGGGEQSVSVDDRKLIIDTMKSQPQGMIYYRVVQALDPDSLPK